MHHQRLQRQQRSAAAATFPCAVDRRVLAKKFRNTIYTHPRVIVLFGSTSCTPCRAIKVWWEKQTAPEGWSFAYWEWRNEDNPPEDGEDHGMITRAFSVHNPDNTSYPVLSIIEGAKPGAPIRNVVSIDFIGVNTYCMNVLKQSDDCRDPKEL